MPLVVNAAVNRKRGARDLAPAGDLSWAAVRRSIFAYAAYLMRPQRAGSIARLKQSREALRTHNDELRQTCPRR